MNKRKKWAAALGSGVLAAMLLGGALTAPAAFADPVIDPNHTPGSLTIYKYETPNGGSVVGDGQALPSSVTGAWTPIPGVTFTVRQVVGIDLTENSGWQDASALHDVFDGTDGSITGAGYTFGAPATPDQSVTTATGLQKFSSLPIGLYIVTETGAPTDLPTGTTLTPAAPFLVSIPISSDGTVEAPAPTKDDGSTNWLYNVTVYPKNAVSTATKTVTDAGVIPRDANSVWTISGSIKGVPVDLDGDGNISGVEEENNIKGYTIEDQLPEALDYQSYTLKIVDPENTPAGDVTLVAGTDFTFTAPVHAGSTPPPAPNGNTLTIDFLDAATATANHGVHLLMQNAGGNKKIVLTVTTKALESGVFSNTADLYPNGKINWDPNVPGGKITTPPAVQKFGGVEIRKTDDKTGDQQKTLDGAVFEVYTGLNSDGTPDPTKKVTIDGVSQWVSGTPAANAGTGVVTIDGLRYSDWADGKQIVDTNADGKITDEAGYNQYYLVEVKAPEGYSLLAKAQPFTVEAPASTVATDPDIPVVNVPWNGGFNLPLTGGTGTAAVLVVGGVLVAGGIAFLVVLLARRRKAQNAADKTAAVSAI